MPLAPPVTIAVFPSSLAIHFSVPLVTSEYLSVMKRKTERKPNAEGHRRPAGHPRRDRELGDLARRAHVGSFPDALAQGRSDVGDVVSGHLPGFIPGSQGGFGWG